MNTKDCLRNNAARQVGHLSALLLLDCQELHSIETLQFAVAMQIGSAVPSAVHAIVRSGSRIRVICRGENSLLMLTMEKRSRYPYNPIEVMLPCSNVKCTRTEYASSTTVGDLASSYHSGLPAVVSAPMQGKQSVYRTSSTCECTFGSTFESQAVSSFHSTVLRNPSRMLANILPSSLYSVIALLITRLTLENQTIDQRQLAMVGCLTHADTITSRMLPSE